jgi:general secretion pathway protein J
MRPARGFTLVEVLVALLVMAVMAGLAWRGIDGIVRSRDVSQSRLEQSLRLNTVLAQWEQDLLSVQETPAAPAIAFDGATLRLTRQQDQGMQVVAWSLRGGGDGNRGVIQRWAGPVTTNRADLQEQWLATQQFLGNETGQLRTLEGVTSWQLYFFRSNAWSNAQSSADVAPLPVANPASAPTAVRQLLPSAVRLVVNFAEGSGLSGSLTRDIALGPQQP